MTDQPTQPDPTAPRDDASPYAPPYGASPYAAPGAGQEGQGSPVPQHGGYDVPSADQGGYGAPGYGAPGYGTPGYGTPGYDAPGYDAQGQGAPAYGQGGYGAPAYGSVGVAPGQLAGWGSRVLANLLDSLFLLPGYLLTVVGVGMIGINAPVESEAYRDIDGQVTSSSYATDGNPQMVAIGGLLLLLGSLITLGLWIWNRVVKQGRGQSWGKKVMGLWLVDEQTGRATGAGKALLREIAHYLDSLAVNIGYLWPLWDAKRQTFADKLCSTVIVKD